MIRRSIASILAAGLCVACSTYSAHAQSPAAPLSLPPVALDKVPVTRVTISVKDAPIREAFQQLKKQTGMGFTLGGKDAPGPGSAKKPEASYPEDDQHVTIDVKSVPLWPTLLQLLSQTRQGDSFAWCMSEPDSNDDYITRYGGKVQVAGPFLIVATEIRHEADFRYDPRIAEEFGVTIRVLEDPAILVATNYSAHAPSKALDEKGNSLVPTRPLSPFKAFDVFPRQCRVDIGLERPSGAGQKISVLEGTIPLNIITDFDSFDLDPSGSVDKQYGDIKATFSAAPGNARGAGVGLPVIGGSAQNSAALTLTADFVRPDSMKEEDWQSWRTVFRATLYGTHVLDANGNRWGGMSLPSNALPNHWTMILNCQQSRSIGQAGPAAKVVFRVPTRAATVLIPYHFENLVLP